MDSTQGAVKSDQPFRQDLQAVFLIGLFLLEERKFEIRGALPMYGGLKLLFHGPKQSKIL